MPRKRYLVPAAFSSQKWFLWNGVRQQRFPTYERWEVVAAVSSVLELEDVSNVVPEMCLQARVLVEISIHFVIR